MPVHHSVTRSIFVKIAKGSSLPIYTPGWRDGMWSGLSCLIKQRDGKALASLTCPTRRSFSLFILIEYSYLNE